MKILGTIVFLSGLLALSLIAYVYLVGTESLGKYRYENIGSGYVYFTNIGPRATDINALKPNQSVGLPIWFVVTAILVPIGAIAVGHAMMKGRD